MLPMPEQLATLGAVLEHDLKAIGKVKAGQTNVILVRRSIGRYLVNGCDNEFRLE